MHHVAVELHLWEPVYFEQKRSELSCWIENQVDATRFILKDGDLRSFNLIVVSWYSEKCSSASQIMPCWNLGDSLLPGSPHCWTFQAFHSATARDLGSPRSLQILWTTATNDQRPSDIQTGVQASPSGLKSLKRKGLWRSSGRGSHLDRWQDRLHAGCGTSVVAELASDILGWWWWWLYIILLLLII